jgi:hypothetical protein
MGARPEREGIRSAGIGHDQKRKASPERQERKTGVRLVHGSGGVAWHGMAMAFRHRQQRACTDGMDGWMHSTHGVLYLLFNFSFSFLPSSSSSCIT